MRSKIDTKPFEKLIELYNNISLEDIKKADIDSCNQKAYTERLHNPAKVLTGFSSKQKCILCKSHRSLDGDTDCDKCYTGLTGYKCYQGDNKETYYRIEEADSAESLLEAFRARARYIRNIIDKYNKGDNNEKDY